jgi:hypothetical protein
MFYSMTIFGQTLGEQLSVNDIGHETDLSIVFTQRTSANFMASLGNQPDLIANCHRGDIQLVADALVL